MDRVALATKEQLSVAQRDHPRAQVEDPPTGALRVRMPIPVFDGNTATGPAICERCQREVGAMLVRVSSIFGLEADLEMLNGPWRVY
jgi:hypothetical protein